MPTFEQSVHVSCPPETAFDFLTVAENIVRISPPEAQLKMIDAPERLELGSRIEFELGGWGPAQRILHEITEHQRPDRFTETLVRGPLKSWVHEHIIESGGDGAVRVLDRIYFEPPGGFAGFLVTEERIRDSLETSFEYRHRKLKRLLEELHG